MGNYSQCPNLDCQANWGVEEISFQECDACGWPNADHDDEHEDYVDEDVDIDEEPEYYYCLGCGWTGDHDPRECPQCCGWSIEAVY